MKNTFNIEHHPDWYYDIPEMKVLILGSFPPHPNKHEVLFYYPNKQNHFWRILAEVAGEKLEKAEDTVEKRKQLMRKLKVGVQNMGKSIQRKGTSANDTDIRIEEFQDVLSIIRQHPELECILLPGFSAPDSTHRSFIKYLRKEGIAIPELPDKVNHETVFTIEVNGHKIKCAVLNSTSPATRMPMERMVQQFKKYIK